MNDKGPAAAFLSHFGCFASTVEQESQLLTNKGFKQTQDASQFLQQLNQRMDSLDLRIQNTSKVLDVQLKTSEPSQQQQPKRSSSLQLLLNLCTHLFDENEILLDDIETALHLSDSARIKLYKERVSQFYATQQKKQAELIVPTPIIRKTKKRPNDNGDVGHSKRALFQTAGEETNNLRRTPQRDARQSGVPLQTKKSPLTPMSDVKSPEINLDSPPLQTLESCGISESALQMIDDEDFLNVHNKDGDNEEAEETAVSLCPPTRISQVTQSEYDKLPNFLKIQLSFENTQNAIDVLNQSCVKMRTTGDGGYLALSDVNQLFKLKTNTVVCILKMLRRVETRESMLILI